MTTAVLLVALAWQAYTGLPNVREAAVPIVPAASHASDAGRAHSGRTVSPRLKPADAPKRPRHQLSGKASWYGTGKNGAYASACRPLRRAMGAGWRGKQILVSYGTRTMVLTIEGWCGSRDKTVDISDEAFSWLSRGHLSKGVLKVTVGW